MTEPVTHDDEDLPPDHVVEVSSVEDDEPVELVEGDQWPEPPEDWKPDVHAQEYANDPDVTIVEDDTPDSAEPLAAAETQV